MKSALRAWRIGRVLLRYRLDALLDGTPAERWLRLMRPFVPRASRDVATLSRTQEIYVTMWSRPDKRYAARVRSVAGAADPATRSTTSVCLTVEGADEAFIKAFAALLEKEGAAYDVAGYRDAPAGLRIWCGATVETADVKALTAWLDFAFETQKATLKAAA